MSVPPLTQEGRNQQFIDETGLPIRAASTVLNQTYPKEYPEKAADIISISYSAPDNGNGNLRSFNLSAIVPFLLSTLHYHQHHHHSPSPHHLHRSQLQTSTNAHTLHQSRTHSTIFDSAAQSCRVVVMVV